MKDSDLQEHITEIKESLARIEAVMPDLKHRIGRMEAGAVGTVLTVLLSLLFTSCGPRRAIYAPPDAQNAFSDQTEEQAYCNTVDNCFCWQDDADV